MNWHRIRFPWLENCCTVILTWLKKMQYWKHSFVLKLEYRDNEIERGDSGVYWFPRWFEGLADTPKYLLICKCMILEKIWIVLNRETMTSTVGGNFDLMRICDWIRDLLQLFFLMESQFSTHFQNKRKFISSRVRSKFKRWVTLVSVNLGLFTNFARMVFDSLLMTYCIILHEQFSRVFSSISHNLSFQPSEIFEMIRYPATLILLAALILLCIILVIGVARNSRCNLIFFSVVGLFGIIICWLLSGIYLASSVALGDFCMQPSMNLCNKFASVSDIFEVGLLLVFVVYIWFSRSTRKLQNCLQCV